MVRDLLLLLVITLCTFAGAQTTLPERTFNGVTIREEWIPMRDGVKLAVNLFVPADIKPGERIPALLEYLPYRKDDWSVSRDYALHSYFVHHRYVVARVDVRGTGRSQGLTPDREYSEQEQRDGEDVIAWLATQSWSNGNVGMLGISWGGLNSIQMAMRRPPALKAIIAVDASDDLFHDDIHYIDGMMHVDEFELSMDLTNALSPAPDFPIDEKTLAKRFDTPPWFLLYLRHQRDGEFWRRASLSTDFGRIQIPVFLIGGFLDGYRDSIPRMLANLKGPRTAIVGPWNHSFPHDAEPGPAVEWRDLATVWWDHWLKPPRQGELPQTTDGNSNDVEHWPMLRVYIRDAYKPDLAIKEIPGEWRATDWPTKSAGESAYFLGPDHLLDLALLSPGAQDLQYKPASGVEAGFWWGDLTVDQNAADDQSQFYESAPLQKQLTILGFPEAELFVSANAPLADWFTRLEDLAPDGTAQLVTGGGLNGAQRYSNTAPSGLTRGEIYHLMIPMHFTSWTFPAGHRIRLAVSNALWPMIWPTPYRMTTQLQIGSEAPSKLTLPIVNPKTMAAVKFAAPTGVKPLPGLRSEGEILPGKWTVNHDAAKHATTLDWHGEEQDVFPWGEEITREHLVHTVNEDHPAAASVHGEASMEVKLKERILLWSTTLDLRSDEKNFYYEYTRELRKDGGLIRQKTWQETIPRDHQ